ncbi:hypothetical protein E5673_01225 [Sphingomonas sp. PAMC26645]|uniref:hypothetical protein n=1 Tax=Sphingomonas sp. PAMC26645 TaxID=2565555 RepID=UPI00109DCAAA|nr:hypothetical protein [Sphingomonas sp. PAMC26645]QCB41017.1 hypothetical protein E5673_01225 [Sphingomonas sp. PAMC26645]
MLSLHDEATMQAVLALPIDPHLRALLTTRIIHYAAAGVGSLTHIVVVQPGDTAAVIMREIGLYPTTSPIDGTHFGSTDFHPFWDWLQDEGGWFEMIVTVGDTGFAYILLIENAEGVDSNLLALCNAHVNQRNKP